MNRQIVDPDPGKNYDAGTVSAGEPHFEMEKINIRPNRS